MESEKVKEIKKVLEEGPFTTIKHHQKEGKPILVSFTDILTLINELESENESCYEVLADLKAIIKQQNDRIAELEKENVELKVDLKYSIDMQKQMLDGFKTTIKEVEENLAREIPNLLKQFAERLKEKIKNYCGTEYENAYYDVTKSSACDDIDETLNEFLKGENNE